MLFNARRILNSAVYSFLTLILFCLTLLTPADFIYQCYTNHRLVNIFIVAGVYILTLVSGLLLYASRIYTNRTALSSIPKAWIPVAKGEIDKSVRRVVEDGLSRSAIIAFQARPRNVYDDTSEPVHDTELSIKPERPPWGAVSHAGWSAPSSPDLPGLQYAPVIAELPHLIEAKAVSLVPSTPLLSSARFLDPSEAGKPNTPDPRLVELLQRPATMPLRDYIGHLTSLNLVNPPELGSDFLAIYEQARFSCRPLFEDEFRTLMGIFAELLRNMTELDYELVQEICGEDESRVDSESFIGPSDEEGETDTLNSEQSRASLRRERSMDSSAWSSSFQSVHTAPMAPNRSASAASGGGLQQNPWSSSLQRPRSITSRSSGGGSVIRLVRTHSSTDLPFEIDMHAARRL